MEKMLVTQGLNELNMIHKRIAKALNESSFVSSSKISEKNVNPGVTKEVFSEKAKASFDKISDLINRRELIKAAIVKSNAETEVEIAGQKMSVAKAIDTKDSIEYKKELLAVMMRQYAEAQSRVNVKNAEMEKKIDRMIEAALGKDSKDKVDENMYNAISKPIKAADEFDLVDPINIKEKIDELTKFIEEFESEVDAKLQVSNCITYIEIE